MNRIVCLVSVLMSTFALSSAHAVQSSAKAQIKVVSSVAVNKVSDLIFQEAAAGSPAEMVSADNQETSQNASFKIIGAPNYAITIALPQSVNMTGPGADIMVDQFTSNAPSQIDMNGNADLFIGATRASLPTDQNAGDYEGEFFVDVAYQ